MKRRSYARTIAGEGADASRSRRIDEKSGSRCAMQGCGSAGTAVVRPQGMYGDAITTRAWVASIVSSRRPIVVGAVAEVAVDHDEVVGGCATV